MDLAPCVTAAIFSFLHRLIPSILSDPHSICCPGRSEDHQILFKVEPSLLGGMLGWNRNRVEERSGWELLFYSGKKPADFQRKDHSKREYGKKAELC
jgi:hypothetical protein